MGQQKLSERLLEEGFFLALGSIEKPACMEPGVLVKCGTPNTYDYNNGAWAVYDELGRPWIIYRESWHTGKMNLICELFPDLRRGAYVPHSNDGGEFMRKTLPTLK